MAPSASFATMQHSTPVQSLDELMERLRELFSRDQVDIEQVKELMISYKSNPTEWSKYTHYDPIRYTRNLVDSGNGKYNLMILCWPKKIGSTIHDHADAHCVMKILSGSLYEVQFSWPTGIKGMEKIAETRLDRANSVAYINDSIGLHRVENRDEMFPAVSLHLYCPPFDKCHVFDEQNGLKRQVSVTFDTKHTEEPVRYKVSRRTSASSHDVLVFEQSKGRN